MLHQFVCENIKGDNVKSLPEVEVSNIHCFPLIHQASLLITESCQIDLTLTFPSLSTLSSPNYIIVLLMPGIVFPALFAVPSTLVDVEADWPVFPALGLKEGNDSCSLHPS